MGGVLAVPAGRVSVPWRGQRVAEVATAVVVGPVERARRARCSVRALPRAVVPDEALAAYERASFRPPARFVDVYA
jgi:hypothetical protein